MKTGLSINSKQTAGLPRLFLTLFVFLIPTSSLVTFGPNKCFVFYCFGVNSTLSYNTDPSRVIYVEV